MARPMHCVAIGTSDIISKAVWLSIFFLSKNGNFFRLFLVGDNIVLTFRNSTWVIYKKKHCFSLKVRNRTVAQCRLYFGLHISPIGFCELYNWKDFQGHSFELRECIGGIANVTFLSRAQLPYS